MLSETVNSLVPMVKKENDFEEERHTEDFEELNKNGEENTINKYIQRKKMLRQDVGGRERYQDMTLLEEEEEEEEERGENEEEDLDENRMERMEMENYSLRKRCKRLESIVTQLLENKGKEDDEDDDNDDDDDDDNDDVERFGRSQVNIDICEKRAPENIITSNLTPLKQEQHDNPVPSFERRLSSNEKPSNMKPLFVSVCDFSAESLATPATKSKSPKRSYLPHRPPDHIHIPSTLRNGDSLLPSIQNKSQPESPLVLKNCSSDERGDSKSHGKKRKSNKRSSHDDNDDGISPEEMEQRNEVFRSTYYLAQSTTSRTSSTTKLTTATADGLAKERRLSSSPPYHFPEPSTNSYASSRYEAGKTSPPTDASNSLYVSYHDRFYKHHSEMDHKSQRYDHHARHGNHHNDLHFKHEYHSTERSHHLPTTHYPSKHRSHEPNLYSRKLLNAGRSENSPKAMISNPHVKSPIPIQSHHIGNLNSRRGQSRNRPYPTSHVRRSVHRLMSVDQDLGKYNSDFYTKLPPKLHIVESQNDTGVTLTWNSTSNCDSSLVKSYQLFARELFGHKIGTMKRIGIIDALPLPMSCNIDKLKYHIKYKFAVCAIDIYGRYGKMSNFTGKFELKPKGPYSKLPLPPSPREIEDSSEDSQLEIIM